jgi:hypothetical protein
MSKQVEALSETAYPNAVENLPNPLGRLSLRNEIEIGFADFDHGFGSYILM